MADCYLTKDFTPEKDNKLIEQFKLSRSLKILVNGDFLNHHTSFKDAFCYHRYLMQELSKHPEVIFLNGNNDPDISQYNEAVFLDKNNNAWVIKHGHFLPKFLCRVVNLFKTNNIRSEKECFIKPQTKIYDKWDKKYGLSCVIIAHYHFECICIYNFLIMKPNKLYKLIEITDV